MAREDEIKIRAYNEFYDEHWRMLKGDVRQRDPQRFYRLQNKYVRAEYNRLKYEK